MKHYKKIEELLHSEFDDYSYFKWELNFEEAEDNDEEYYTVDLRTIAEEEHPCKTLHFKVTSDRIEIETGEDTWKEVRTYDWRIKYFWMTVLNWDI